MNKYFITITDRETQSLLFAFRTSWDILPDYAIATALSLGVDLSKPFNIRGNMYTITDSQVRDRLFIMSGLPNDRPNFSLDSVDAWLLWLQKVLPCSIGYQHAKGAS